MADYIKFRLTAAKASVTLALLALLGGLPGAAGAKQTSPGARPASFSWGDPIYIKLTGLSGEVHKVFSTLEYKVNSALSSLSHKISTEFYDKHKIDTTFLKIDDANKLYYKESQANATFLKIEDANASFLKITDANGEFLKLGQTATNSSELGGLTPDAFFQGHGNVVSGAVTITQGGSAQQLLSLPGGIIVVSVSEDSDGVFVTVNNGTGSTLPAVQYPSPIATVGGPQAGSFPTAVTLQPGNNNLPLLSGPSSVHELTVQILPNAAFQNVVTMILTTDPLQGGGTQIAAQAFTGGV